MVGLDFSPAGLTRFILPTNPPPFDLVHGDATRLPFQSCTFDISLASVLVHHLRTEELRETCIRELHRTVKLGGEVILSVYGTTTSNGKENRSSRPSCVLPSIYEPGTSCGAWQVF